ncbi:nucleotidyltransferase family protein [Paenibacillus sp. YYML68]|uniref:nucleotidyltransferase domain-containing protein n=1 Tax=Paenibacillus sp. YYML68 TaxID=2909250 RepID=UPI00249237DE|nr:nucleotidyltransferase family protein [Paenibacillus sp. YYML68]
MNHDQRIVLNHLLHLLGPTTEQSEASHASQAQSILNCAIVQGIGAVIFPILHQQHRDQLADQQGWSTMKERFLNAALRNKLYMKQIQELLYRFQEAGIPVMVLKGIAIGRLYPKPEYRMMSDVDLYVQPEHWHKSMELLKAHGYTQTEPDDYNVLHIEFQKTNAITVELHRNLIHTDHLGDRDKEGWYAEVWRRKQRYGLEQLQFEGMSIEDELIHQITHFAAHFVYYGTKLRHLFEMALIASRYEDELDWAYMALMLKRLGFYPFACLLWRVCGHYFHTKVPHSFIEHVSEEVAVGFMEDLLEHYSCEIEEGDTDSWLRVMNAVKPTYATNQLQMWLLIAKVQYKTHGLKLPCMWQNGRRNVRAANKKIAVIRQYGLNGSRLVR